MIDRPDIRSAAGRVSLGMLADEALIATIKFQKGRDLDQTDLQALRRVEQLLQAVAELGSKKVIRGQLLKTMASVANLDETFQTVSRAQVDDQDFSSFIGHLAKTAGAIVDKQAPEKDVTALKALLERLSVVTFEDSKDAVKPSRTTRVEWIRRALTS